MVKMMRKDQVAKLSPESRIKNSYESLYYRAGSGDPESDEIVKGEIQQSFRRHGVILHDKPSERELRDIMLDAYKKSTQELGGENLSPEWEANLTREFDTFTRNHSTFYSTTFDAYERKYKGEPVDFAADVDRMIQENNGVDPFHNEPSEADIEAMHREKLQQFTRSGEMKAAGLSYAGHAPGVRTQAKRSYQQVKLEEAAARDVKGTQYDKQYDRYARERGHTYQKTTAGDDYGFDERDYELEDDGPEL
ncbi:hypothetical protein [Metabacillus sp. SLBN-84]